MCISLIVWISSTIQTERFDVCVHAVNYVTAMAADLQQQYLGSGCVRSTLKSYRCSCIGVVNY